MTNVKRLTVYLGALGVDDLEERITDGPHETPPRRALALVPEATRTRVARGRRGEEVGRNRNLRHELRHTEPGEHAPLDFLGVGRRGGIFDGERRMGHLADEGPHDERGALRRKVVPFVGRDDIEQGKPAVGQPHFEPSPEQGLRRGVPGMVHEAERGERFSSDGFGPGDGRKRAGECRGDAEVAGDEWIERRRRGREGSLVDAGADGGEQLLGKAVDGGGHGAHLRPCK